MADPTLIVAPPLRASDDLGPAVVAQLVAVDAAVAGRRLAAEEADWVLPVVVADQKGHWLAGQELARAGEEPDTVGADRLAEVVAAGDRSRLAQALEVMRALRLTPLVPTDCFGSEGPGPNDDVAGPTAEPDRPGATGEGPADATPVRGVGGSGPEAATATFVALFEAGLLELREQVVSACPRCGLVDPSQLRRVGGAGDVVVLRLAGADGSVIEVEEESPELVVGAVALVVPGWDGEGGGVGVAGEAVLWPGRTLPVVVDSEARRARLLIPGHRGGDEATARRLGLPAPVVMTSAGVMEEGPAAGMARFAARSHTVELMSADGAVSEVRPGTVERLSCGVCGTELVERMGAYWFAGGTWLSAQLPSGVPVPAASCGDCGRLAVSVSPQGGCKVCMGPLRADGGVLDPLFVAAAWAAHLARSLHPGAVVVADDRSGSRWPDLMALVLTRPAAAAAGVEEVTLPPPAGDFDPTALADAVAVVGSVVENGPAVVRTALVLGCDAAPAAAAVDALRGAGYPGPEEAEQVLAALAAIRPAEALRCLLASAERATGPAEPALSPRSYWQLAAPVLGVEAG
ncbi:MAG TPA: hypothetical protein VFH45_04945 [Acidimicrobiales bacterium]|nr:hypothetical protein [Acidimicrobiales bacterium]